MPTRSLSTTLKALAPLTLLLLSFFASAEAPRGYIARPIEPGADYSQRARDAYNAGVWTLDEIAAADSSLSQADASAIYERARAAFDEAVGAEPSMYEAHTYLGYVHRALGDFDASLRAYDTALKLKPDYVYAIEYQGEAYLGVGNFDRARFNYLRLYALDQNFAAQLLEAIAQWLHARTDQTQLANAHTWLAAQRTRGSTTRED